MKSTRAQGSDAEDYVAQYLEQQHFTILHKNYTKRFGEVDLIARQGDLLVFVEVKMRRHTLFDLTELITRRKQKKIVLVAKTFLAEHSYYNIGCRFDVALVQPDNNHFKLTYLPDAFRQEG